MPGNSQIDPDFAKDYEFIRKDVRRVILTNLLFIGLLVALYFLNKQFAWLEQLEKMF